MDVLKGDGTVGNPYLIEDIVDWNLFAGRINNGDSFEGMNVKLAENIGSVTSPVTMMAGKDETYCFKGIFDGNGKTMIVAYNTTESVCAPFRYVNNATIKNLTVQGVINTSSDYASGLVGNSIGSVTISNCVSKIEINSSYNGNGYDAGFIGLNANTVSIQNCTFAGKLLGVDTISSNGFIGKNNGRVTVRNCLFIPSEITMDDSDSWTFVKDGTKTINDSYFIQSFGTEQGIQATLQSQNDNTILKTFEGGYQCYVP